MISGSCGPWPVTVKPICTKLRPYEIQSNEVELKPKAIQPGPSVPTLGVVLS